MYITTVRMVLAGVAPDRSTQMCETLDELLSNRYFYIHKELDVDTDGNRVLDVRWFTQILRVTVDSNGLILREEVYSFDELYEIEVGWWNEDKYL